MKFTSAILTQASGSLGGATASRNKGGGYFRARVAGTNPSTDKQVAQRSLFALIAVAWRELTDVQRTAWAAAAPYFPYTDSLGQTKTYSGAQLFNSLNGGIKSANPAASLLTDPPAPVSIPNLTVASFTAVNDAGEMALAGTFTPTTVPTGFRLRVNVASGLSAGISNPPASAFKLLGTIAEGANISTQLAALDNSLPASAPDSKLFLSMTLVSTDSGQMREVLKTSVIVTAA